MREWLFAIDVEALLTSRDERQRMPVGGSGDDEDVQIWVDGEAIEIDDIEVDIEAIIGDSIGEGMWFGDDEDGVRAFGKILFLDEDGNISSRLGEIEGMEALQRT